jgi:hypothetical protein
MDCCFNEKKEGIFKCNLNEKKSTMSTRIVM